jgi:hypothetical protein
MTFVAVPEAHPSAENTVAVAMTAMMERKVSQPIDSSQLTMPGSFCPWTPKAARDSTMVGTEPRFPAMAMMPHSRNDTTTPTMVTATAWPKDTPKPYTKAA